MLNPPESVVVRRRTPSTRSRLPGRGREPGRSAARGGRSAVASGDPWGFEPIQLITVDVAEPLPLVRRAMSRSGVPYCGLRALVLLHDVPMGVVWFGFDSDELKPAAFAEVVLDELGDRIQAHLRADGADRAEDRWDRRGSGIDALVDGLGGSCAAVPSVPDGSAASVVLATRGRPASLRLAIDALLRSDHPDFEIVVVDNSPQDGLTAALIAKRYSADPRVRLVAEPMPGLSYARNCGLRAAKGDVVAFTDDDVVVRPSWLSRIAAEFAADPFVTCVTGLVEPMELESLWQWWFECAAGFGRGIERRVYDLCASPAASPLFPYELGSYGTGASMALRKSALPTGWAFDEALGAGSPAAGGEDLDLFLDALALSGTLVYQPAALSFHRHREDAVGLHAQMRGYGRGLTALLVKRLLARPQERTLLLRRAAAGLKHLLGPDFRSSAKDVVPAAPYPRALRLQEALGMLQGPATYLLGVRRARRMHAAWRPGGQYHSSQES